MRECFLAYRPNNELDIIKAFCTFALCRSMHNFCSNKFLFIRSDSKIIEHILCIKLLYTANF